MIYLTVLVLHGTKLLHAEVDIYEQQNMYSVDQSAYSVYAVHTVPQCVQYLSAYSKWSGSWTCSTQYSILV